MESFRNSSHEVQLERLQKDWQIQVSPIGLQIMDWAVFSGMPDALPIARTGGISQVLGKICKRRGRSPEERYLRSLLCSCIGT